MKNFILTLISIIILTGCVKSDYHINYVDMQNPTDTLSMDVNGVLERFSFRGKDTFFEIKAENAGIDNSPVFVYSVYVRNLFIEDKVYSSAYPIMIVNYRYVGRSVKH